MKLKYLISLCAAGAFLSGFAQSHVEGVEYYKADQFGNAKELLERNFNNPATDKAVANYYLGLIAVENGDLAKAAQYFDAGVAANPDYGYNYAGQGLIALKNGDAKAAEKLFKMGEGKAKKDASYLIDVARAYEGANPVTYEKEIAKYVEKARKITLSNPDIYLFEGDVLRKEKDFNKAAGRYEMASTYSPNSAEAYVKYANLFTQVNPKFAITKLQEFLSNNPNSALGQRELANAYYNNGDFKQAAQEYGKYVKNPNHFKSDEDRYAFLLFYGQDYQNGYDYSTARLNADPSNFSARRFQFINAAQIPALKDQLLPMAEALLAAHRQNPSANKFAAIDYNLIAEELQSAKRGDEAVQLLQEAITDQPDNANFNKQLALAYVSQNNLTKAAQAFNGYLEKSEKPGFNDYNQQATYCYYAGVENKAAGDMAAADKFFDETARLADKLTEMMPTYYKAKKFHGDIALAKANSDEEAKKVAQPYYEEAVVLLENSENPSRYASDAKAMYNYLGNYYLDQKDKAKAKEYFSKYLNYDPNNEGYRKFVENL